MALHWRNDHCEDVVQLVQCRPWAFLIKTSLAQVIFFFIINYGLFSKVGVLVMSLPHVRCHFDTVSFRNLGHCAIIKTQEKVQTLIVLIQVEKALTDADDSKLSEIYCQGHPSESSISEVLRSRKRSRVTAPLPGLPRKCCSFKVQIQEWLHNFLNKSLKLFITRSLWSSP